MAPVGTMNLATRIAWMEKTLASVPAGYRILDAGAGEQQYKKFCGHLKYVSQDIAEYDGSGNKAGLQTGTWDFKGLDLVCDITSIPEPDGSFDAIICTEVFEHIVNPALAIKEFSRLLRPGGLLILTAPFCSMTHFAPYHYSTGFSRYFYEYHLPANGLEITEVSFNGNWFEYVAQETRRMFEIRERYSPRAKRPRRWDAWALKWALKLLQRFSESDTGSWELMCFGLHVQAVKK